MERMLSREVRARVLDIARGSIEHAVVGGGPLPVDASKEMPELQPPRATFTTLEKNGALRGCTGVVVAFRPLAQDVAATAASAATQDTRFPPVQPEELPLLDVSVSVLSPMEPLEVRSEQELVATLRPGVDGLMLTEGMRRGVFLPQVWQTLPRPRDFLEHLRRKASLPPGYWSDTLQVHRFTVEKVS